MRLFWLTVLGCFLWVSTHEVVDHAGSFCSPAAAAERCLDGHDHDSATPDDPADADDDHHDCDSHRHLQDSVVPAKPIAKPVMTLETPVVFDSVGTHPQEHLLLSLTRVLYPPEQDPPPYLSAQTLLL